MYEELRRTVCPTCGIIFGIHAESSQCFKDRGKSFVCPNGHVCLYTADNIPALKDKLAIAEKKIETLTQEKLMLLHRIEELEAKLSESVQDENL